MTTTATEVDLSQFSGKKVIVVRNLPEADKDGNTAVEIECTVEVGNQHGLLVKPKGKVQLELIPASEIEPGSIRLTEGSSAKLSRSKLQIVKLGQARRHLLERHGVTLEWVNKTTEQQAFEYHAGLDHEELDLGHVHVEKKDKDAGDAEKPVTGGH